MQSKLSSIFINLRIDKYSIIYYAIVWITFTIYLLYYTRGYTIGKLDENEVPMNNSQQNRWISDKLVLLYFYLHHYVKSNIEYNISILFNSSCKV